MKYFPPPHLDNEGLWRRENHHLFVWNWSIGTGLSHILPQFRPQLRPDTWYLRRLTIWEFHDRIATAWLCSYRKQLLDQVLGMALAYLLPIVGMNMVQELNLEIHEIESFAKELNLEIHEIESFAFGSVHMPAVFSFGLESGLG